MLEYRYTVLDWRNRVLARASAEEVARALAERHHARTGEVAKLVANHRVQDGMTRYDECTELTRYGWSAWKDEPDWGTP